MRGFYLIAHKTLRLDLHCSTVAYFRAYMQHRHAPVGCKVQLAFKRPRRLRDGWAVGILTGLARAKRGSKVPMPRVRMQFRSAIVMMTLKEFWSKRARRLLRVVL